MGAENSVDGSIVALGREQGGVEGKGGSSRCGEERREERSGGEERLKLRVNDVKHTHKEAPCKVG